MVLLIRCRGFLALALGLAVMITNLPSTMAQVLPDYESKAGMMPIGLDPSGPMPRSFMWPIRSKALTL